VFLDRLSASDKSASVQIAMRVVIGWTPITRRLLLMDSVQTPILYIPSAVQIAKISIFCIQLLYIVQLVVSLIYQTIYTIF